MTYRVIVEPRAEQAIRQAADWIRSRARSRAVAQRWVRELRAEIAGLAVNPQRCPVDPDSEAYGEEVRVLLFGRSRNKYRVLFALRGPTVRVLTVRHTSRRSLIEELEEEGDQPPPA